MITYDRKSNFRFAFYFFILWLTQVYCSSLPSQTLRQTSPLKFTENEDLCAGQEASFIPGISCSTSSCSAQFLEPKQIDITSFSSIVICYPLTSNTFIDLSNIVFQTSSTTSVIIFSAQRVSLANISFQQSDSSQKIEKFYIQSSSSITLKSLLFSNPSAINTIFSSDSISISDSIICTSTLQASSTKSSIFASNFTLNATGSVTFSSSDSLELNSFSLNINSLKDDIPQNIQLISSSKINLANKSWISAAQNPIVIQSGYSNNEEMSQQLIPSTNQAIILETLKIFTGSSLRILSGGSIIFLSVTLHSETLILTNSPNDMTASIFISFSYIFVTQIKCKSHCDLNDEGTCENETLYPVISLLADSTSNNFQISNSLSRYGVASYSDLYELIATNFTLSMISMNSITIDDESTIRSSNLGIYSSQVTLEEGSSLLANELGCRGGYGVGAGIVDSQIRLNLLCGGPGGSHAMVGGSPLSEKDEFIQFCQEVVGRSVYGDAGYPVYEGSGGGGYIVPSNTDDSPAEIPIEIYGGAGGGFIYLEAIKLLVDGAIDASGGSPNDYSFLGAGAGGSIQVHTNYITGKGKIRANGGSQLTIGGQGGAGRIKMNITSWSTDSLDELISMSDKNLISVELRQGSTLPYTKLIVPQDQQYRMNNGSLITTPCPPGFAPRDSLFACVQCPPGYFNSGYDLTSCRVCLNNINSSRINFNVGTIQTVGNCTFNCNQGYKIMVEDGQQTCLTAMESFQDQVGGKNVIYGVILSVLSILLNIAGVGIYKSLRKIKKRKKQFRLMKPLNKTKVRMANEDLPFHQQRIYIEGENTYTKPWRITDQVKLQIVSILQSHGYSKLNINGDLQEPPSPTQRESNRFGVNNINNNNKGQKRKDSARSSAEWDLFSPQLSASNSQNDSNLQDQIPPYRTRTISNNNRNQNENSSQQPLNLWSAIERAVAYSKWEKFVLSATQVLFPISYYYIGSKYKKRKWTRMKLVISTFLLDLKSNGSSISIKFSCSSCFCQGFFDFVDYSQSELQWDIQAKLPLCLLLKGKGSFMSPYLLNDSDPMFALLVMYMKQKAEQINFQDDKRHGSDEDVHNNQLRQSSRSPTTSRKPELLANYSKSSLSMPTEENSNVLLEKQDNHEIAQELIELIQIVFNKINVLSRMITFSSKLSEYKTNFKEFVRLISDNQEVFEILSLNVQVSIHHIMKPIMKGTRKNEQQQLHPSSSYNRLIEQQQQDDEVEDSRKSTFVVLPQKIKPGSFAEKQLELELERTYLRKKDKNDFEMKISLIFSKDKIYDFEKQYTQEMDSINSQLQWICYPHKDQVRILMQHTEDQLNYYGNASPNQLLQMNNDIPNHRRKESNDSGSVQFELLEVSSSDEVSRRSNFTLNQPQQQQQQQFQSSYLQQNHQSQQIFQSNQDLQTIIGNKQRSNFTDSIQYQASMRISNSQNSQKNGRSQSSATARFQRSIDQIDDDDNDNFKRKLSAINYTYMYEMLQKEEVIPEKKSKPILVISQFVFKLLKEQFSRYKSISQSYRHVKSKYLSNLILLRVLLFFLILSKIVLYYFIHIVPINSIIIGESNTYTTVYYIVDTIVFPFATFLCIFFQLIWLIKKDTQSGKKCLVLNSMELISSLITMPLTIILLFMYPNEWQTFLLNTGYLVQNLIVGFFGGIFLFQNKEKPISIE